LITANLVEARKAFPTCDGCEHAIRDFFANKMEMTMRKKMLTALVVSLISAFAVQAAAASERHHTRKKDWPVASEQYRNSYDSNAYVTPNYGAAPFSAAPSRLQELDDGEMASGPAGH
jgi:hypothetical protein